MSCLDHGVWCGVVDPLDGGGAAVCSLGEEETVEDPDAIAATSTDPSEVQLGGPVPATNGDGAPTAADSWQAGLEEAAGGVEPSETAQGAPASGAEGATAADGTPMARS